MWVCDHTWVMAWVSIPRMSWVSWPTVFLVSLSLLSFVEVASPDSESRATGFPLVAWVGKAWVAMSSRVEDPCKDNSTIATSYISRHDVTQKYVRLRKTQFLFVSSQLVVDVGILSGKSKFFSFEHFHLHQGKYVTRNLTNLRFDEMIWWNVRRAYNCQQWV